jgi:hypothetical protein
MNDHPVTDLRFDDARGISWSRIGPVLCSIGLYGLACVLPALVFRVLPALVDHEKLGTRARSVDYQSLSGFYLLVTGLLFGWTARNFAAFANFPLWLSWIFFLQGKFKEVRAISAVALVMSLQTLQLLWQPYWFDEAGTQGYLAGPHVGLFCWVGSMFVILFSSNLAVRRTGVKADKIERGTWPTQREQDRFDKFTEILSKPVKTDSLANRRVKTLDGGLVIYQDRDLNSPIINFPPSGTEIQLGSSSMVAGREWLEAILPNGFKGYALGPSLRSHTA